jgi:hypothetical protein
MTNARSDRAEPALLLLGRARWRSAWASWLLDALTPVADPHVESLVFPCGITRRSSKNVKAPVTRCGAKS